MKIAIVHYSAPPVVGGVEAVILAHTGLLVNSGFNVRLVAGVGELGVLPSGVEFIRIPEMHSLHPDVVSMSQALEKGQVPDDFERFSDFIEIALEKALESMDIVIVHNIFTKHFNLPLTAALVRLLDRGYFKHCIAWCHDFSWTSPHSRASLHPGYPWDLLRTYRQDVTYVTISRSRQEQLAELYHCPMESIHVIYDGVDPADIYSLSEEGQQLIQRCKLAAADLVLLMPVRITQAKNIEFALQILARLKSEGIQPKLVITGPPDPHDPADMEYYRSLLEVRRQLKVDDEACFVYESGPCSEQGYTIGLAIVRELYRVCDALLMPSHREGFGMPILEAGMIGMPIFSVDIPAAQEIGSSEVMRFSSNDPVEKVAHMVIAWASSSPTQILRQRIRQNFTWQSIFQHDMLPLLAAKEAL